MAKGLGLFPEKLLVPLQFDLSIGVGVSVQSFHCIQRKIDPGTYYLKLYKDR